MKKFLLISFIEIVWVLVLFVLLPSIFIDSRPGPKNESITTLNPLYKSIKYVQTLPNEIRPIDTISLQLKNPVLQNKDPIYIDFYDQNGEIIYSSSFNGSNVGDPSWIDIKLPPNAAKSKTLSIFSPNQLDNTLYIYSNSDSLNYKTTYTEPNLFEKIKENTKKLIVNIYKYELLDLSLFLTLLVTINILISIQKHQDSSRI